MFVTFDALGRPMRPRCGKAILKGVYWGEQVCGRPEGHYGRCWSEEGYKRYLIRAREDQAHRDAAKRERKATMRVIDQWLYDRGGVGPRHS